MKQTIDVTVPDIGDFSDVAVIEVMVCVGDIVKQDDTVIMLETDKATMDIPCPKAGKITEVKVSPGDLLNQGNLIATLEVEEVSEQPVNNNTLAVDNLQPTSAAAPEREKAVSAHLVLQSPPPSERAAPVYASPSIRQFARTLGVNVSLVVGSGPKGRIMKEDVEDFIKGNLSVNNHNASTAKSTGLPTGLPEWPKVDYASFGPVERLPLSRIARLSGPALARNALIIPHVCNFDEADVTELESFRKKLNAEGNTPETKLSLLAFIVKAVVATLKKHPKFNSSLDAGDLIIKHYWNIGVAADTPEGLVVPVIKNADHKGLREIAAEMASLAADARAGRLKAADMQGAGFTISSLGGIGGTNFTPIINAPEVAILGMTRARIQPVWDGSAFQPRLIQPLSLSWDHRAVDGVAAARFLQDLASILGDFRRISL